jgi:hypothetical protein
MASEGYATGAVVDATVVALAAEAGPLRALCEQKGLRLAPIEGVPPDQHPLVIELWRVRDGRPEAGGRDQHQWSEQAAAAAAALTAAPLGALVGAGLGAWMGPVGWWLGSGAGWMSGAAVGGRLGGAAGRQLSEAAARTLGTYDEIAVTAPGVFLADGRGPFQLVLGMYASSAIALWTAQTFGYGFGKRLVEVGAQAFGAWAVREEGRTVLEARFDPPADWLSPDQVPQLAALRAWTSLPFLGSPGPGQLAISVMDRAYHGQGTQAAAATGLIQVGEGFLAPITPGEHIPPLAAHVTALEMRLGHARPV